MASHLPLPDATLPNAWCDFNACGWSGQPDDNCYYVVKLETIPAERLVAGAKLFVWDHDGDGTLLGCQGELESFQGNWRVRPIPGTRVYDQPIDIIS